MDGKKIFGIIIVAIGLIALLNSIEVIDVSIGEIISSYWPLVLIGSGLFNLIKNPASKTGSIILIFIGVLFQLRNLGYFNIFDYNIFWPIIIILIGLKLLSSNKNKNNNNTKDNFNGFALFSGSEIKNSSKSFKGGSAFAAFGGVEIDLRDASILEGEEARIDIFAAFGGIEIRVPEEWNVVINCVPVFGGVENSTDNSNESPTLVITGIVAFGGAEIRN